MPSPFPGMDPYLEGYLWPDVHHRLATQISRQLGPQIQPRYVARLEISVIQDETPEVEIGIMYPDVEVIKVQSSHSTPPVPSGGVGATEAVVNIMAPLTVPLLKPMVRLAAVEIRNVAHNELVTSIEILSPVNKREPHLSQYRQKRRCLQEADIHLLEIDLLRRDSRAWTHPRIPDALYLVLLTRAQANAVEVWPIRLPDKLPTVPVPLRVSDSDATLDLMVAMTEVYDEAFYHLSIDYNQDPPPPSLETEVAVWLRAQLETR